MTKSALTGSRVRERRIDLGLRQAEVARRCEISPSYLNLIEHNRRRIGGRLLVQLAEALDVEPGALSEGAETALLDALRDAASGPGGQGAEAARLDEFAARFPGWARLVAAQSRRIAALERTVEALNDRLTHDPFLSASLHDILSTVTAIRSASAILNEGGEIDPEWQKRFHRNIHEDSRRLTESSRSLVTYLDAGGDIEKGVASPMEEFDDWLLSRGHAMPELDTDPSADPEDLLRDAGLSAAGRALATRYLARYAEDARRIPLTALSAEIRTGETDPDRLARRLGSDLPVLFRRLAALGRDAGFGPVGLVTCDGSGTLTFRKSFEGFDLPRHGAACPLLPLYQALSRPGMPIRGEIEIAGRNPILVSTYAFADIRYPDGFGGPAVTEASMLMLPASRTAPGEPVLPVGTSCRICPRSACAARREPSILAETV